MIIKIDKRKFPLATTVKKKGKNSYSILKKN